MAFKPSELDQPLVFALAITLTVIGMMAFMSWFFSATKMTGALGLVKGGVI